MAFKVKRGAGELARQVMALASKSHDLISFSAQNPQGGMNADSNKLSSDLHLYAWHPPTHVQTQINKWFIF